ncbi:MAG TPA: hypothetical protein VF128_13275 [Gemmatimonadaceae bacterium]
MNFAIYSGLMKGNYVSMTQHSIHGFAVPPLREPMALRLTGVAAGGGVVGRAEALAFARVHAILLDPPQLNVIR